MIYLITKKFHSLTEYFDSKQLGCQIWYCKPFVDSLSKNSEMGILRLKKKTGRKQDQRKSFQIENLLKHKSTW